MNEWWMGSQDVVGVEAPTMVGQTMTEHPFWRASYGGATAIEHGGMRHFAGAEAPVLTRGEKLKVLLVENAGLVVIGGAVAFIAWRVAGSKKLLPFPGR